MILPAMAPSANAEGEPAPSQDIESSKKPLENGAQEQVVPATSDNTSAPKGKAKAVNGAEQKESPAEASKDGKLSGKELKEKAKAEKAARRAQQKGGQPGQQGQPIVDLGPDKQGNKASRRPSAAGAVPIPKIQHKRTGSASGGAQKPIPFRPAQAHATPIPEEPKKENKNVALFDHLYGNPRRTTVAGASKDVHPAVLALGLQMRNYVICGSSARCVATMLAFKRVSVLLHLIDALLIPSRLSKHTSPPRRIRCHAI